MVVPHKKLFVDFFKHHDIYVFNGTSQLQSMRPHSVTGAKIEEAKESEYIFRRLVFLPLRQTMPIENLQKTARKIIIVYNMLNDYLRESGNLVDVNTTPLQPLDESQFGIAKL
jgi:hypothetical protein